MMPWYPSRFLKSSMGCNHPHLVFFLFFLILWDVVDVIANTSTSPTTIEDDDDDLTTISAALVTLSETTARRNNDDDEKRQVEYSGLEKKENIGKQDIPEKELDDSLSRFATTKPPRKNKRKKSGRKKARLEAQAYPLKPKNARNTFVSTALTERLRTSSRLSEANDCSSWTPTISLGWWGKERKLIVSYCNSTRRPKSAVCYFSTQKNKTHVCHYVEEPDCKTEFTNVSDGNYQASVTSNCCYINPNCPPTLTDPFELRGPAEALTQSDEILSTHAPNTKRNQTVNSTVGGSDNPVVSEAYENASDFILVLLVCIILLVVLVSVTVVCCCCWKKRSKRRKKTDRTDEQTEMTSSSIWNHWEISSSHIHVVEETVEPASAHLVYSPNNEDEEIRLPTHEENDGSFATVEGEITERTGLVGSNRQGLQHSNRGWNAEHPRDLGIISEPYVPRVLYEIPFELLGMSREHSTRNTTVVSQSFQDRSDPESLDRAAVDTAGPGAVDMLAAGSANVDTIAAGSAVGYILAARSAALDTQTLPLASGESLITLDIEQ